MPRLPAVTERSGRFIIALLLCIKLVLLVWNAKVYDGVSYESAHHADRAMFGGLKPGKLAYDPPLYYLPARLVSRPPDVPLVERSSDGTTTPKRKRQSKLERAFRAELLDVLRYSNVLWVGFFYVAWIGYAFPRLLRSRGAWFLASLLLLAVPGYQKLAAMSHPDNLFAAASAFAVCAWLWLRERFEKARANDVAAAELGRRALRYLLGFALAIALVGLTRPLALSYVMVLTVLALVYTARFSAGRWSALARAALVVSLIGVLSTGWYVLRWSQTGAVLASVRDEVTEQYRPLRAGFPYVRYFRSFYIGELWETPNDGFGATAEGADPRQAHANSFPTLVHSEVWGDHWLSFSGPKNNETKAWPKRISVAVAAFTPLVTLLMLAAWLWSFGVRVRQNWRTTGATSAFGRLKKLAATFEIELALSAICLIGVASYLWWQTGPALMPGTNSSVKFIHMAAFLPAAIALPLTRPPERWLTMLLGAYLLVLFCAAFPVAMYWPD
jgi:hypothetical protein